MPGVEAKNLEVVNDRPTDSKEITDSMDWELKEAANQAQEDEQRVIDFSQQELEESRREIQEKAEPAYKYAHDLIDAIDFGKNPNFIERRKQKYEEVKRDPRHNWQTDLWKRTTACALAWNSIKEETWEIISDDEYTDDTVDKAVRYMMALWDATNAAEQLAVFRSQKAMYENVAKENVMA